MHPRNKHNIDYNFKQLVRELPELESYVRTGETGQQTIDFSDPSAVKALNKALIKHFYGVSKWDIPVGRLTPPVPGRADYIHHLADLLKVSGKIPRGPSVRVLDIGTGANCIYPIIGIAEYGWRFLGTDIDPDSLVSAKRIVQGNARLKAAVKLRQQNSAQHIFKDIIKAGELFDVTLCNPPFHGSLEEAHAEARLKWSKLGRARAVTGAVKAPPVMNFAGGGQELWCPGGEERFLARLIQESSKYPRNCLWFTTLVSRAAHLPEAHARLKKLSPQEVREVPMEQGQKKSRFLAWTFQDKSEHKAWQERRAASTAL